MSKSESADYKSDLLIVDDNPELLKIATRYFTHRGFYVEGSENGALAEALMEKRAFDVVVVDMMMPGISGIDLLKKIKSNGFDCEVIMLTGQGSIESAVEAMKFGAHDYLTKPIQLSELELIVRKAHETRRIRAENQQLKAVIKRSQPPTNMIGRSELMQDLYRLIQRAGPSDKPILIQGESGTGKELVALALHQASQRDDKPMVVINCAALPHTLLESELFGHEKGAFTGAISAKPGLFELADGGTLFIDEIGELAGALQAKLLRVLEDGSLRRIGSLKERRVKVRLLAATNRDLSEEVKKKNFREDLFYRINVVTLNLPPLCKREGDLPLLANHFAGQNWEFEPQAMQAINRYWWPGNVRQLINAIDRAKILADDHTIQLSNLPPEVVENNDSPVHSRMDEEDNLATIQRSRIIEVLKREGGNKAKSARSLGVSRRTLYRLLEKHSISMD